MTEAEKLDAVRAVVAKYSDVIHKRVLVELNDALDGKQTDADVTAQQLRAIWQHLDTLKTRLDEMSSLMAWKADYSPPGR